MTAAQWQLTSEAPKPILILQDVIISHDPPLQYTQPDGTSPEKAKQRQSGVPASNKEAGP